MVTDITRVHNYMKSWMVVKSDFKNIQTFSCRYELFTNKVRRKNKEGIYS